MKKNFKQVLAKGLAVTMACTMLFGATPVANADAAAKPKLSKSKVTVKVGKTTKVTVKGVKAKKIKRTTWSVKSKKIAKITKKSKTAATIKGVKAGKTVVTAKVKVGKKVTTKKVTVTVKKNSTTATKAPAATPTVAPSTVPTAAPTAAPTAKPTAKPTEAPVGTVEGKTIDESQTYSIALTDLNEGTMTCDSKRPEPNGAHNDIMYNKDGSVTFYSNDDYNSGVQYYMNPCTDASKITDVEGRDGYLEYKDCAKDMSAYDYIRIKVKSANEMNCRTYEDVAKLSSQGFPGDATTETYEGGWVGPAGTDVYMKEDGGTGKMINDDYQTRTLFIPIASLMDKGYDPAKAVAIAFCPQRTDMEVTIYSIDFVKVKYDTKVTALTVTADKTDLDFGKVAKCTAATTPKEATRKIVKWASSDETLATVNSAGQVTANTEKEGTVTITATSTDGSDVKGTVDINIKKPAAGKPMKSHVVDLASADVTAAGNDGAAATVATLSAAGVEFNTNNNMAYVNFSAYLTANNIDLSDYTSVDVTYAVKDAEGKVVEANAGCGWGKVALVASAKLNGYDGGVNGWMSNFTTDTKSVSLVGKDAATIADIAGFNIQFEAIPAGSHVEVSKIKFVKDYNTYVTDLSATGISAAGNDGAAATVATLAAASIEFNTNNNMAYVNFADYLTANSIDLTNYKSVSVGYKVVDAEGNTVAANAGCGWGKVALVAAGKLNGYDGGINGWMSNFTADTKTVSLEGKDATEVAAIAGFNIQFEAIPAGSHVVVTSLAFNNDYNTKLALDSTDITAAGNDGAAATVATQSAAGIEFNTNNNMAYVNFANYLTANSLDLADYDAIAVSYKVVDAEGKNVEANAGCGWGKVALVAAAKLNGYDGGINGWMSNFVTDTKTVSIAGKEASEIAALAGFNIQFEAIPAGSHIVVSGITLVYNN